SRSLWPVSQPEKLAFLLPNRSFAGMGCMGVVDLRIEWRGLRAHRTPTSLCHGSDSGSQLENIAFTRFGLQRSPDPPATCLDVPWSLFRQCHTQTHPPSEGRASSRPSYFCRGLDRDEGSRIACSRYRTASNTRERQSFPPTQHDHFSGIQRHTRYPRIAGTHAATFDSGPRHSWNPRCQFGGE